MKKLRVALVSIAMAACVAVFGACGGTVKVLSVEKTATDGLVDTYTITYSDGSKFNFTVTNGADGENAEQILPSQAYEDAVANGYTGTYTDFLGQYVTSDTSASVSTALKSSVSVYAEHPVTEIEYYYTQGPFGGGIGRLREVCGAVSGMVFVLSNIEGYSDPKDKTGKKELYIKVQELTGKFREEKGSIICRELLKGINADTSPVPSERTPEYYRTRGCRGCVECAAGILEKYLEEKKEKGK